MVRRTIALSLALLGTASVAACGADDEPAGSAAAPDAPAEAKPTAKAERSSPAVIAKKLRVPWGVAFVPGGDALVSERTTGRILRVPEEGGRAKVVMRVPGVDTDAGEGGLLGIAVSKSYAKDKLVYAYYTGQDDNRVVRFPLVDPTARSA